MNRNIQDAIKFIQSLEGLTDEERNTISHSVNEIGHDLKIKDRDLEIEAALEKVRVNAMSMKKPDDLLEICEILFTELRSLGFNKLRNAMINIHNDEKGSFLNYDFSDLSCKTITNIFYNSLPVIANSVKQIRKADDAFAEFAVTGKDLEDWKEFRKNSGEYDDPRIESVSALYYYFYSIGTGAIGISTFGSIDKEKLEVLKRFRNVFNLCYQRFIDISLAEAHAKETQIELSLERVRARSMAMHSSDELVEASDVLFEQLKNLGIESIRTGVAIFDELKETLEVWSRSHSGNKPENKILGVVPKESHPFFKNCFDAWKEKKEKYFSYEIKGDEVKQYYDSMSSILSYPEIKNFNPREFFYIFFFPEGSLNVVRNDPLSEEEINLMERFARVFGLIYRRFLDLQNAEAQAREAQIQLALERVRARTMAMQHSDELSEAALVLFQQVQALGIKTGSCGYNIWEKDGTTTNAWMSSPEGGFQPPFKMPHTVSPIYKRVYDAKQEGKDFYTEEVGGDLLKRHFKYLLELPVIQGSIQKYIDEGYPFPEKMSYNIAFFKQGYLTFHTNVSLSEYKEIFNRFGKVFEQTYTRFLDLKQAEAQTREAKIEASLERVRSKAMAMHNSDDLTDAAGTVFTELNKLGINPIRAGFVLLTKNSRKAKLYPATSFDNENTISFTGEFEFTGHPIYEKQYESWEKKENYFPVLEGEVLKSYYKILSEGLSVPIENFNSNQIQFGSFLPFSEGFLFTWSNEPYSENEINILSRFKVILDLTIRRYHDLKKAEAQSREAKIELALERVRARTLAMHESDELEDVADILLLQLKELGITAARSYIGIFRNDRLADLFGAGEIEEFKRMVSDDNYGLISKLFDAWRKKKTSAVINTNENQFECIAYFSSGFVAMTSQDNPSDDPMNLLERFAGVFNLTYTRFLDLQQAEAQAREARIEAALERTRTQSMIMQHSKELDDTLRVFHEQVLLLGINSAFSFLWLPDEDKEKHIFWAIWKENKNGSTVFKNKAINYLLDRNEPATRQCLIDWKSHEPVVSYAVPPEGVENYFAAWQELINGVETLKPDHFRNGLYYVEAFMKYGCFGVMAETDLKQDEKKILGRFAVEFERTFTRFLDLQKAEAQAREAQIETALERVRSRTLAMHKSDELAETAAVVFKQLINLGIEPNRLYISIIKDESGEMEFWITGEDGSKVSKQFIGNANGNESIRKMFDGWKEKRKSLTIDMYGDELKTYFQYLNEELNVPFKGGLSQKRRVQNIAYFSKGFIGIASPDEQPVETTYLLERFAAVFNLTYARFNDLQNAEAQTHKAQIETALEKVRARALAMQQPEELQEVAHVLREEMGLLRVEELETSTIFIHDENSDKSECWFAVKDKRQGENKSISGNITLQLNQTSVGRELLQFFNSNKDEKQISIPVQGKNLTEWLEYIYSALPTHAGFYDDNIPDRTYYLYKFSNGAIGASSSVEITEQAWDLLKRTASVFSLAYSRYKDLTQARFDLQLLKEEKKRSDSLLLNILPLEIAEELKQFGKSYARKHEEVSILFADIKGFSAIAESLSAGELVNQLDECFRAFDNIVEKHGLEKIKTIGDAYVCACGLPKPVNDNAYKTVKAALDMLDFIKGFGMTKKIQNLPEFDFRIGIHTGSVITGVVGLKKFTYDIWGDAVNMAARMEQHGEAGKINISGNTHQLVKNRFTFTHRGKIEAKNKGEVDMYFVEGNF